MTNKDFLFPFKPLKIFFFSVSINCCFWFYVALCLLSRHTKLETLIMRLTLYQLQTRSKVADALTPKRIRLVKTSFVNNINNMYADNIYASSGSTSDPER